MCQRVVVVRADSAAVPCCRSRLQAAPAVFPFHLYPCYGSRICRHGLRSHPWEIILRPTGIKARLRYPPLKTSPMAVLLIPSLQGARARKPSLHIPKPSTSTFLTASRHILVPQHRYLHPSRLQYSYFTYIPQYSSVHKVL